MAEKKSKLVEIKTKPTAASVEDFIHSIQDEQKRKDSLCFWN
jgi:tetrahydromethanopterin S-methyltransferase subunit F